MPIEKMATERGLWGFVREISVKYEGQILKGDEVEIVTEVFYPRPTLLTFHQTIFNKDGKRMVEAVVDGAFVNKDGRPVAVPQDALEKLRENQIEIVQLGPNDWE